MQRGVFSSILGERVYLFFLPEQKGGGGGGVNGAHYFSGKEWGTLDVEEAKSEVQLEELLRKARTASSDEIGGGESDMSVTIVEICTFHGSNLEGLPGPPGTTGIEVGTFNPPPLTQKAIERFNHAKVRREARRGIELVEVGSTPLQVLC